MPRSLRECAALVSLAAAPVLVPVLERLNGPLQPEQKALLGSVLFVVGVNHRDALLEVALSLLSVPGNLLARVTGSDDDACDVPPLVPLVVGGIKKAQSTDAPQPLAYVRCRHDKGVCARQPPPEFRRTWDDALGMVPADAAARWRAEAAARAESSPVAAPGEVPPPRARFVGTSV